MRKEEIVRAASSSTQCRALLEHVARIARPNDGAPLMLLVFARMATVACDWLDGDLHIVLEAAQASVTRVTVATELGSELREKVFPTFELGAPLDEFVRAVQRIPHMVSPLVAEATDDQLRLTATAQTRTSAIPWELTIDESLLTAGRRASSS